MLALALAVVCLAACGSGGSTQVLGTAPPPEVLDGEYSAIGPVGGPFTASVDQFRFENTSEQAYEYALSCDQAWVTWDVPSTGTVAAGDAIEGTLSIDATSAPTTVGPHFATVEVMDSEADALRAELTVYLEVYPEAQYAASGTSGGPFSGSGGPYRIENPFGAEYPYEISSDVSWVTWDVPSTGSVPVDGELVLNLSVDASAAPANPGSYPAVVSVRDADTQAMRASIAVRLVISDDVVVEGWSDFTPGPDSREVFVSSSTGNDANDGLSNNTPKRSIAAGIALLRSGNPDFLYLRRGDEWNGGINWPQLSGRSEDEPMVVYAYGPETADRPLLHLSGGSAVEMGSGCEHVVFMHVHCRASVPNVSGVRLLNALDDVLFEDFLIEGCSNAIVFHGASGRQTNLRVRRCVLVDSAWSAGHSQGLFSNNVHGLLIEGCVFDHNGWRENAPGFEPTIFNHNMYIQRNCTGVTVRDCIVARGASHGLQLRPGGSIEGCLFIGNAIHLLVGDNEGFPPDGVNGRVWGNVLLDARNITSQLPRGWGMDFENVASCEVSYNILAHQETGTLPRSMAYWGDVGVGIRNTSVHHNVVYNYLAAPEFSGSTFPSLEFRDNDVQLTNSSRFVFESSGIPSYTGLTFARNRFYHAGTGDRFRYNRSLYSLSQWASLVGDSGSSETQVTYPAPESNIDDYDLTQPYPGNGTLESFLSEARQQSRSYWRPKFTANEAVKYFQEAFAVVPE